MIRIDDHIRELETFIDVTMHQLMLSIQDFDPETNSQEQEFENSSQYSPINTRSHSSETCVQSDLTMDQHCCNQSFNSINLITPNNNYSNLVGKTDCKETKTHALVNHPHDMLYKDGQYYMCEYDDHKMNRTRQPVLRSSDSRPLPKNIVLDDSQTNPTKNKRRLIRKSFSFNAYGRAQSKNDHKSDQNSAKWGSLLKTRKLSIILQGKPLQTDGIRDSLYGHSKPTLGGVPPFQWPRISALLKRLLKFGVLRHSDHQSRPHIRNEPFLTQKQSNIRNNDNLKAENDKLFNTYDKTDIGKTVNESLTTTLAEENLCLNSENEKKKPMISTTTQVFQDQKSPPISQEKQRKKTEQLRKSLRRLKSHQIFRGGGTISLDPYKSEREDDLYMCYQLPTFREDETLYLKAIQSFQPINTFENLTMPNGITNANGIRLKNHHHVKLTNQTSTDSSRCLKRPTISQILESIERTYHCSNQNNNLYNTFSLTSLKDAPQNFTCKEKSETLKELNTGPTNENRSANQSIINIVPKTEKSLNTSIITPHPELYLFRINKVISPANRLLSTKGNIWLPNSINSNLLNKTLPNMPRWYNESEITQENKSIPYDKEDITLEADELMLSLSSTLNLNSSNDSPDPICCSTPLFQENKSKDSNTSSVLEQTFTGAKLTKSFNESISSITSANLIDLKQLDSWEICMLRNFTINHIKNIVIKKMDCLNNLEPTCESPRSLQATKAPTNVSRYMTPSPPIISTDRSIHKHKKDIRASFRRIFKKGNVSNKINDDNSKHLISTSVSENLHRYTISSHHKKLTKSSFDVFGLSLRDYAQLFGPESIIPPPISICCMRAIEREHETQIGLFRKAGSRQRISKLREWINEQSTNFVCEKMTQHNITDRLEKERLLYDKFAAFRTHEFISLIDVGDVIKQFYRQLHGGPLFNATYGTLLVTLFKLCNLNPTVAIEKPQISTKDLVALILCTILPLENRILLRAFLQTLNCISRGGQSRQTFCPHKIANEKRVSPPPLTIRKSTQKPSMSARGLAICLVPTLFDMDVFESPNHHVSYNSNNENCTNAIKCNKISTHLSDTETKQTQTIHCGNDCSQKSLESIPQHQKHNNINNNITSPPKCVKKLKRGKTFYPNACTSLPLKRLVEHKKESQHTGKTQERCCLEDKLTILKSNPNSYHGTKGLHDQKLENENNNNNSPYTLLHINDAIDCLTYMIENYSTLFRIPISILTKIRDERNKSLTHKQSSTNNIMIT